MVLPLKAIFPVVDSLMPDMFRVVAKGFPIVLTFVGLLTTKDSLMLKKVGILTKGLFTFFTGGCLLLGLDYLIQ
jgi:hypothetical protein